MTTPYVEKLACAEIAWRRAGRLVKGKHLARHVRGSFFVEYVRMVRRRKEVDWAAVLDVDDFAIVQQRIDLGAWYPMETFERLGLTILSHFEGGFEAVRLWGSFSATRFAQQYPDLIAAGDPVETLMRLKVLRGTLFDFPAFDVPTLIDGHAVIAMQYEMGATAEEAACHQTLGFCEGVAGLAGARAIRGGFGERSWLGASRTVVTLDWSSPGA